jgi:hypothetical protein
MNEKKTDHILSYGSSKRLFVRKRNIIDSLSFASTSIVKLTEKSIRSSNKNCCRTEEKKVQFPSTKTKKLSETEDSIISQPNEFIIEVPKQARIPEVVSNEKCPLFYEVISNAWPLSNERVENLTITNKRCHFANEAISIKPITAGIVISYLQVSTLGLC